MQSGRYKYDQSFDLFGISPILPRRHYPHLPD